MSAVVEGVEEEVTETCALCAVAQPTMEMLAAEPGSRVVAYLDSELIALLEPGVPGVLLAPRSHVKGLSTSPGLSAVFLAALRRAVTEVQASYGTSGAMIEPTTEVPGAVGHVCYHVVPTLRDELVAVVGARSDGRGPRSGRRPQRAAVDRAAPCPRAVEPVGRLVVTPAARPVADRPSVIRVIHLAREKAVREA